MRGLLFTVIIPCTAILSRIPKSTICHADISPNVQHHVLLVEVSPLKTNEFAPAEAGDDKHIHQGLPKQMASSSTSISV